VYTVAHNGEGATAQRSTFVERLGERTLVYARLSDGGAITAEDEGYSRVKVGDTIGLTIKGDAVHLFDPDERGYHAEARSE
jgi:multiple sugar transport system ATP-binding protein